jgi:hypothetical protein
MKQHKTNPRIEETLTQMYRDQASPLIWLASLLTGDHTLGAEAVIEVLNSEDAGNPFFENWMVAWSRKLVIAKALDVVRAELQASVLRTELRHFEYATGMEAARLINWSLAPDTDKAQLERALRAIDLFPRCALLLMAFEKVSVDDAVILLDADKELVTTAKAIGLVELARNLAGGPSRVPTLRRQGLSVDQMQHLTI